LQELKGQVAEIIEQHNWGEKPPADSHATIFHGLLESKMPDEEKALNRLGIDGFSLVRAGTETMGSTLSIITYHLLSKPHLLAKLREELLDVFPNPDILPKEIEFEKLPYLNGVVHEGLRLAYGVSTRLQRIDPDETMQYGKWTIPPGTSTGMTGLLIHQNPDIFPDPLEFKPERWVENPRLDKYLMSFSKG
jgi:cytochrome P450